MGLVKKKRRKKKINDFVNCIQVFIYLFVLWCRYAEDLVFLQCFSSVLGASWVILAACIAQNTQYIFLAAFRVELGLSRVLTAVFGKQKFISG